MRVLEQKLLIVLIFLPTDVARVIVAQQDIPIISGFVEPADLPGPSVDDLRSLRPPAVSIGAGIERIVKDLHGAVVSGRLPDELVHIDIAENDRHFEAGRAKPQKDLPCAAQLAEFGEDQIDRLRDMLVGIKLDFSSLAPTEARVEA